MSKPTIMVEGETIEYEVEKQKGFNATSIRAICNFRGGVC